MIGNERKYDVVVAGGGLSGVAAAVAAAREGCSVMLLERYGFLGGMATAALVNPFMPYSTVNDKGEIVSVNNGGIFMHILNRLSEMEGLYENGASFNEEILKFVLDRMICENNIDILLHSYIFRAQKEDDAIICVKVANKFGEMVINGRYFIDATGDADVAFQSGCSVETGRKSDGLCQPMTLCFRIGNLSNDRIDRNNLEEYESCVNGLYKKLREDGKIKNPRGNVHSYRHIVPGIIHFNSTRITKKSALDPAQLTEAEIEAREQVYELLSFMKTNVKGYEDAHLIMSGTQIGIRESRRIVGEYVLTMDDLFGCEKFEDSIARGCYCIDIHDPDGPGTLLKYIRPGEYYTIPYRSLVPRGIRNLIVAGRPISATHEAHAAIRVMPICTCVGEGAGTAAAIAAKEGYDFKDVNVCAVQHRLSMNSALF